MGQPERDRRGTVPLMSLTVSSLLWCRNMAGLGVSPLWCRGLLDSP